MPEQLTTVEAALVYMAAVVAKRCPVWGAVKMCHLASTAQIVADYGGKTNTQMAAVFHEAITHLGLSKETVEEHTGSAVFNMINKVSVDVDLSWVDRTQKLYELASKCCQGVGIVLLADSIDTLRSLIRRERDYPAFLVGNGGESQRAYYNTLCASFDKSERVSKHSEYPELRTDKALQELKELSCLLSRLLVDADRRR